MSITKKSRVVSLVDMDCFYVQVVQRKDPSLLGKPCAVVQYKAWKGGGIIAVGYEARKFGVTRQMRGDDAKKKCPEIILVHVPESRGKADLTQFREAGAEVIEVLSTFTDCLERASIDEAYMDLTNSLSRYTEKFTLEEIALRTFQTTHLIGLDNIEVKATQEELVNCDLFKQWTNTLRNNKDNYNLAIGAVIADDMRNAVKAKTGFSCSAGIGPNKVLAKVVAGFHKPNQQTLILPENVAEMFQTTQVRKVRSLGGKLGLQLEEKLKVQYMSELCSISLNTLQSHVGEKNGELVYWLCRGIDHEPVRPRQLPKSVGCSKNFMGKEMLTTKQDVHKWVSNLAEEVWERLEKEKENNSRVATLFTVGCSNENKQHQSKRCSVINQSVTLLRDEAFRVLSEMNKNRSGDSWVPGLVNLSFCASKFQSTASASSVMAIRKYMCSGSDVNVTAINSEQMSYSDIKKFSPRKNKEKKAIMNYFAVNKEKLKELGRSDNRKICEVPLVSDDSVSQEVNGLKTGGGYQNQDTSVQHTHISHDNVFENHIYEDGAATEDEGTETLQDSLPEDPLDFTAHNVSSNAMEIKLRSSKSAGFPNNDLHSLYSHVDNQCDQYARKDDETNKGKQVSEFTVVSSKCTTSCDSSILFSKSEHEQNRRSILDNNDVCQSRNNLYNLYNEKHGDNLSSRLPYNSDDVSCEEYIQGGNRKDTSTKRNSCDKKHSYLPNSGEINFSNSSRVLNSPVVCTSYSRKGSSVKDIPATYPFDKRSTKVNENNSIATSQPARKGFFATIRSKSNASSAQTGNCQVVKNANNDTVHASSLTSRKGYFASLVDDKNEPDNDNFFTVNKGKKGKNLLIDCKKDALVSSSKSNFFEKNTSENICDPATEKDTMSCEKCGKRILVWDFPEHADFHYAKEVQDSMKKEFLSLYNNKQVISPVKKKSKPNNSMMTYFSPACKK